jgi:hypothetical protein
LFYRVNFIGSREYACVPGLDLLFHLNSNLPVVFDHALLVLLAVEVLPARLRRTIFEENSTVFTVKFLAHLYNRLLIKKYMQSLLLIVKKLKK